jgi:hypothetical protein
MAMTRDNTAAAEFRGDWARFHPACLPLGWMLRGRAGSPWVRFHALPGSKRYADDKAERDIILSRAYALGNALLGIDQCCWVVEGETGDPSTPSEVALSGAETDDPDDPVWSFYARRERWRAGTHDAKLLSIADDEPRRAIWMRCDDGAVFAPYDGGFDLFPTSWEAVNYLKAELPDWLSDLPSDL